MRVDDAHGTMDRDVTMATTKEHVECAEGTYVTHSRWPDPKSGPWLFAKIEHIYGDRTVESVEFPASEAEGVLEDLAAIVTLYRKQP